MLAAADLGRGAVRPTVPIADFCTRNDAGSPSWALGAIILALATKGALQVALARWRAKRVMWVGVASAMRSQAGQ